MTISKFRELELAAKELKDYCNQIEKCEDCLFAKEYLRCPFQSELPYMWEFEKKCEEGMTRRGKWIPWDTDTRGCTLRFACSVCGNYTTYYEDAHECDYDYCPNCGAKMDLKK